jgi:radical SAM protein with 4Fe4S-binding SPASM domain
MCYEWGEVGWCHDQPKKSMAQELSWSIISNLFAEVAYTRPYFILIGGEPLLYSRFTELAGLVREHRCCAIVCTNGLLLEKYVQTIAENPYLTFLISLDGPEAENDHLRGRGVYRRVTTAIRKLKALTRPPYLAIEFTIRPENVHVMYDFCRRMVEMGVDWVLLNPCWFISEQQAREYEKFMSTQFGIIPRTHLGYLMPYELDKHEFIRQSEKIQAARWPIQISCYLQKPEDIHVYVDQPQTPPGNTFCYRQWSRMDVTPHGDVAPCILYPDLLVGNLNDGGVLSTWNSPAFGQFRQLRRREVLPVCAKCNALYLHDAKRKYL